MNKRILITSTDLMMIQFLVPHVINLSENGFDIEIACADVGGRIEEISQKLKGYVNKIHIVRIVRSPISPSNFKGYKDIKKIIQNGQYDIIWTNEPVMGVATRLAARKIRKTGVKVIYIVHGFHFYNGAPKLNWMIFYPIERFMSRFTDTIVTINLEDFERAKKMHAKDVKYIHGIGINTDRLQKSENQNDIRNELGIDDNDFIVLSVGELTKRKNQQVIINALGLIKDKNIHYVICGKGILLDKLTKLAKENNIDNNVHFIGYRKDVVDICSQSDLFVLPSLHEGLSVASLEAMYCGLPVVISNIRGVGDYLENGKTGYICDVDDVKAFANAIQSLKNDENLCLQFGNENRLRVQKYCIEPVKIEVLTLFEQL
ncbi:MAG: glycosyltransferase family 4 protein [Ruminococcus sp.]|nr:glycosyltransferase family 4 protein [Ruminococcus sp.]